MRTPVVLVLTLILSPAGAAPAPARQAIRQDLSVLPSGATRLSPVDAAAVVEFDVILPLGDLAAATRYALDISTDFSMRRGRYLTPGQFRQKFGGSDAAYAGVGQWLRRSGLAITAESSSRTIIGVRGPASIVEAAFGVRLDRYRGADGRISVVASDTATAPAEIARSIIGIVGLSDDADSHFAPHSRICGARPGVGEGRVVAAGSGPGGAFSAHDLRTAYGFPAGLSVPLQAVAIFEQGGFDPADLATYASANALPAPLVTVRGVAGYGGGITDPGIELEAVANIDMVQAIDVGAPIIVYEQGTAAFRTALLQSLAAIADDDAASTVSISYGQSEHQQGSVAIAAENQLLVQLAAQGQSVFVSSGDRGAFAYYGRRSNPLSVNDPASQPFVTSVGGTTLFTDTGGDRVQEMGWSSLGDGNGASGGGASGVWALPVWQRLYGTEKQHSVAEANGGSDTMRNVPDVAAVGDPYTGVSVYSVLNGGWLEVGGTGVAAPIWAAGSGLATSGRAALGMFAVGFFNPTLYGFRNSPFFIVPNYDIINGYNGLPGGLGAPMGYLAGFEYDDVSGWGSPYYGGWLLNYFVFSTANFSPIPPPAQNLRASAKSTSITLDWSPTLGANAYVVEITPWPVGYPPPGTPVQPLQINVTTGTHFTFSGLTPSTNYVAQVMPGNAGGAGFLGVVTSTELVTGR